MEHRLALLTPFTPQSVSSATRHRLPHPRHHRSPSHPQVFPTSQLLPALARRFAAQSLLAPPLHVPLLEMLQLEKKCIK